MLTGKQKQYLKSTAVDFSAVVQIGKEGITDNVINSVTEALAARELIKVKINQNSAENIRKAAKLLSEESGNRTDYRKKLYSFQAEGQKISL